MGSPNNFNEVKLEGEKMRDLTTFDKIWDILIISILVLLLLDWIPDKIAILFAIIWVVGMDFHTS